MTKVAENYDAYSSGKKHASPRAVRYIQNLTQGMSKREAALSAGYSESVANTPKSGIEKSPAVRQLLEKAGITPECLVKKLKEGLNANRLYGVQMIEHPDFETRYQYMITGFRLLGIDPEKVNIKVEAKVSVGMSPEIGKLNIAFTEFLHYFYGSKKI